jgi:hypothetical protein
MPAISSLALSAFSENRKDTLKSGISNSWFKIYGPVKNINSYSSEDYLPFPNMNSSISNTVNGDGTYRGILISTTSKGDIRWTQKPLSNVSSNNPGRVSSYMSSVSTSTRRIAVGTESQGGGITYARLDMFDADGNNLSSTRFYSSNTASNPYTFLSGIAIPERNGAWNTTTSQTTYENVTDTVGVFGKVNGAPIFFDFYPDNSRKYIANTTFTFSTLSEITCACEVIESGQKYYYIAGRDSNATKDLVVYKIGPASASPAVVWSKKYAPFSAATGGTGNRFTYAPVAIRYDKHVGKVVVLANYVDTTLTFFGDATIPNDSNYSFNSGAVLFLLDPSTGTNISTSPHYFHPVVGGGVRPSWATGISIGDPHPDATSSSDLLYNTAYFISMTSSVSDTSQLESPDYDTTSYMCSVNKGYVVNSVSATAVAVGLSVRAGVNTGSSNVLRGVSAKVGGYSSASFEYTAESDVSTRYVVYNVRGQAVINSNDYNYNVTPAYFSLQLEPGLTSDNGKYKFGTSFTYTSKNVRPYGGGDSGGLGAQLTLMTYAISSVNYDTFHAFCQTTTYTSPSNTIGGMITSPSTYNADALVENYYIGTFTRHTFDLGPVSYNRPLKALPNYLERLISSSYEQHPTDPLYDKILFSVTDPLTGKTQIINPNGEKIARITITDGTNTLKIRPIGSKAEFRTIEGAFYGGANIPTWSNTGGLVNMSIFPNYEDREIIYVTKYYEIDPTWGAEARVFYTTVDTVAPYSPPASFSWNVYVEQGVSSSILSGILFAQRIHYDNIPQSPNYGGSTLIPHIATMYGNNLIDIVISGDLNDTIIISRDNSTYPVGGTGGPQTEINSGRAYPEIGADTTIIIGRNEGSASNVFLNTSNGDDKLINASIGMGRVVMNGGSGADRIVIAGAIGYSVGYQYTAVTGLLSTSGDRVDLSLLFRSNGARVASTADLNVTYSGGNYTINLAGYYLSRNGTFADSTRIIAGSLTLNSVTSTNATNSLLFNQGTTLSSLLGSTLYNRLVSESA